MTRVLLLSCLLASASLSSSVTAAAFVSVGRPTTPSRPTTTTTTVVEKNRSSSSPLVSDTPIAERGIAVGVDLGTTNSCVSLLVDRAPVIVEVPGNGRTTPSVVCFAGDDDDDDDDDEVLVGREAVAAESSFPASTYRNVKRVVGSGGATAARGRRVVPNLVVVDDDDDDDDDEARWGKRKRERLARRRARETPSLADQLADAERRPARLSRGDGTTTLAPEEISARVLRRLFDAAEAYVKENGLYPETIPVVTRAVVGVPARFHDAQRAATLAACRAAGVPKARLLDEPEAAALAYGLGRGPSNDDDDGGPELVLAFDLGGGTFDVSVLELLGGGLMEVVATSGDADLGGSDLDARVAEWIDAERLSGEGTTPTNDNDDFDVDVDAVRDAMVRAGEAVRIRLSNAREARLFLPTTDDRWARLERAEDVIFAGTKEEFEAAPTPENTVRAVLSRREMERLCEKELQALLRPVREVAVMARALLPGDASPAAADAALRAEEEARSAADYDDFEDFYGGVDVDDDAEAEALDAAALARALKKKQQQGRKRARNVERDERRFRRERRRADEAGAHKNQGGGGGGKTSVADGIRGRPLSRVVLVGGATRTPAVGRSLAALTGVTPQRTVDPDEAVALGCAIKAGMLDGERVRSSADDDRDDDDDDDVPQVLTPMQAAVLRALAEKRGMDVNT